MDTLPMDPFMWGTVVILVTGGVGGIISRERWVRVVLWIQAVPSLCIGTFALYQGGIAEGFAPSLMAKFCAIAFWPAIGCIIGEFMSRRRKGSIESKGSGA
jgi:hypothetical protein